MVIVLKDLILTCSIVYIVDISGVMTKLNRLVWQRVFGEFLEYNGWYIPLIGCSRCLTFWAVLVYTFRLSEHDPVICLGVASFFSYISPIITLAQRHITVLISNSLTQILKK